MCGVTYCLWLMAYGCGSSGGADNRLSSSSPIVLLKIKSISVAISQLLDSRNPVFIILNAIVFSLFLTNF